MIPVNSKKVKEFLSDPNSILDASHVTNWSGIWSGSLPGNISYKKDGMIVELSFPNVQGTMDSSGIIYIDTNLPDFLRPSSLVESYDILVYEWGSDMSGYVAIDTAGNVKIGPWMNTPGNPGDFTDTGSLVGISGGKVMYLV